MPKYVMISHYGNEIKEVDSERKRDELKSLGYREFEPKEKDLDKMTVAELEAFAKEKGIDLSDCDKKGEKLAKIKEFIEE